MAFVKNILLVVFLSFVLSWDCFAAEWISLHNKAEKIDLSTAQKAVVQNPASLDDLYLLGLVYLREFDQDKAEASFERMLAVDSEDERALWGKYEVLRRRHSCRQDCMKGLEKLIEKDRKFAPPYITLSNIYYHTTNFNKAVRLSYKVIKMGKKNVDLNHYVRAYGLMAGSKGNIAHFGGPFSKLINGPVVKGYLDKTEELEPDSISALFGLGSYYLLAPSALGKDLSKAEKYLNKAIEKHPGFPDTYVRLAQFYKEKGNQQLYEEYLDKALEIDPGNVLANDIKSGTCAFICVD